MDNYTKNDIEEALQAVASIISKTENAKAKFAIGTSHHSLQENRLKALNIASSLLSKELKESETVDYYTKEDLKNALAPLASLISKSEKAQKKLKEGTWQYTMLSNNLKALYIASPLLTRALSAINGE